MGKPENQKLEHLTRRFAKGTIIFAEGEPGNHMYVIQKGQVRISKSSSRRQQALAVLEPGTFFGEMALFTDERRTARAEAMTDCEVLEIEAATLHEFLHTHADAAIRMIETLTQRLHATNKLVERLLEDDPLIQVVETLLSQVKDSKGEPRRWTVDTLMAGSGTDAELLRHMLIRLKQGKLVTVEDQSIRITDEERLRQFLGFLRLQRALLQDIGA